MNLHRWIIGLRTRSKATMKTDGENLRASRLPVRLQSKIKPFLIKQ